MAQDSVLLQGGTVLLHGTNDSISTQVADILVEGGKIAKISSSISVPASARVVDCKDRLISPGFIDTHRHTWQTQLKGRHLDQTFPEYMMSGGMAFSLYTPGDVFWGELSGALESLDVGTTTLVDAAHMTYSIEHCLQAASALESSGVRATYCPAPSMRFKQFSPTLEREPEMIPSWWDSMYSTLAERLRSGSGRVRLGIGYDSYFLGKDTTVDFIKKARKAGAKIVTSHSAAFLNPMESLKDFGLLGPDLLISHFNNVTDATASALSQCGGHMSATPSTELQMQIGYPVCFRPDLASIASLGVDCHSATSASLVSEMRIGLQNARGLHNDAVRSKGEHVTSLNVKAAEVFNLATIKGARAVGMESEIGSIAEGKRADLVIWDATSPSMLAAAAHDPVAAIVGHSSVGDVETVIVDGVVRKEGGKLKAVEVEGKSIEWKAVAKEILESRERIQEKVAKIDYPQAIMDWMKLMGM